jgi:hypothetical protein
MKWLIKHPEWINDCPDVTFASQNYGLISKINKDAEYNILINPSTSPANKACLWCMNIHHVMLDVIPLLELIKNKIALLFWTSDLVKRDADSLWMATAIRLMKDIKTLENPDRWPKVYQGHSMWGIITFKPYSLKNLLEKY